MKHVLRLSALLAFVVAAAASFGQTQGNFAASANRALSAAPGFIYKASLKSLKKPRWTFEIAGTDGLAHKVEVDAKTGAVLKNSAGKLNKKAVTSAPTDVVTAGLNAVEGVAEEYREDTQIMKVEVRNTKKGLKWVIGLKSLVQGDDPDDDDFTVDEDEDGDIDDIQDDDDGG